MKPLRRLLPLALVAASALVGAAPLFPGEAPAQEGPSVGDVESLATDESRKAAANAMKWLVQNQQDDGSWHADVGFKLNDGYQVVRSSAAHVGVTALAGTALLASGSTPGRGPYAKSIERALQFVLDCQGEDGFLGKNDTRMYSHAFATMFLAEVYGMTNDPRVKQVLQRAVEFTYKAQNKQGGWRYVANAEDSDVSITVCQVVALRAAKNKGIAVPKESIDSAVEYVLRSAVTRDDGEFERGSFLYQFESKNLQAQANTRISFALTAAGLTTLYGAGIYTNQDIKQFATSRPKLRLNGMPDFESMLKYVIRNYNNVARGSYRTHYFYWYGNYYAVQAMYIAGGEWWKQYFERVRNDLVRSQKADGSWANDQVGPAFATAVGAITLQMPNNYLPIFQR